MSARRRGAGRCSRIHILLGARGAYADGAWYEGQWRDGKKHGFGTFAWASGARYEGGWRDDMRRVRGGS